MKKRISLNDSLNFDELSTSEELAAWQKRQERRRREKYGDPDKYGVKKRIYNILEKRRMSKEFDYSY